MKLSHLFLAPWLLGIGFDALQISSQGSSEHRVALLLPWIGGPVPLSVKYVCKTVASSEGLADLLLVVEHQLIVPQTCRDAANVHILDLGVDGIAKLHAKQLSDPGLRAHARVQILAPRSSQFLHMLSSPTNRTLLEELFKKNFREKPQYLMEFKPTWGHVFQKELSNYTHWTYVDQDQVFADLKRWVTKEELENFEVVTYTYEGDVSRLFMRGQFSLQKNIPEVRTLFANCNYLTDSYLQSTLDSDHFFSGEGCISDVFLQAPNVRMKFTPKMFTDHSDESVYWGEGRLCRGSRSSCATILANPAKSGASAATCFLDSSPKSEKLHVRRQGNRDRVCKPFFKWSFSFPYGTCVADEDTPKLSKYDSVVKDSQGSFWRVPAPASCGRSGNMVAAIFHYRLWQGHGGKHSVNEVKDEDIQFSELGAGLLELRPCKKLQALPFSEWP